MIEKSVLRMSLIAVIATGLGAFGFCPAPAYGALVAYDGFNGYAAGSLNGANGGSGGGSNSWTGGWAVSSAVNSKINTIDGGLSYSAGAITVDGGDRAVSIKDNANADAAVTRSFTAQTGSEIWFSFLFRPVAGVSMGDFLQFWIGKNATQDNEGSIGKISASADRPNYGARVGSTTFSTSDGTVAATAATTAMLIGRLSRDAAGNGDNYDRMQLWVNPTSTTLGTANATASRSAAFTTDITYVGLRTAGLGVGDEYLVDELRIGTSSTDVVPEPAGLATLAFAGAAILRRRR